MRRKRQSRGERGQRGVLETYAARQDVLRCRFPGAFLKLRSALCDYQRETLKIFRLAMRGQPEPLRQQLLQQRPELLVAETALSFGLATDIVMLRAEPDRTSRDLVF